MCLSAAFDTINILATRLTSIGIRYTAHEWFVSYLTDRQYKVNINSTLSHPHKLVTGVPQSSVLGPLLFNIYIQPLFSIFDKYSHITYHSYADDIQIQLKITDPSSDITTINNCLTDIHDWLSLNSLSLNCHKTEIQLKFDLHILSIY